MGFSSAMCGHDACFFRCGMARTLRSTRAELRLCISGGEWRSESGSVCTRAQRLEFGVSAVRHGRAVCACTHLPRPVPRVAHRRLRARLDPADLPICSTCSIASTACFLLLCWTGSCAACSLMACCMDSVRVGGSREGFDGAARITAVVGSVRDGLRRGGVRVSG